MQVLSFPFLAPVPVGHRVRTYRAERCVDPSGGWLSAGVVGLVYDLDSGVVFGSASALQKLRPAPGEPVPKEPDLRWTPLLDARVVYCHVSSQGGELAEVATAMGVEPVPQAPYR